MAMQLRLSPEEDAMLNDLAQASARSKNHVVAALVREAWERKQNRRVTHALLDEIGKTRSDLLGRLAQ